MVCHTIIILQIGAKNTLALAPFSTADSPAVVGGQSEIEIGSAITAGTVRGRVRCEDTSEVNAPKCPVVAGVKSVDAIPPELKSCVKDVAATRDDHRVGSLDDRVVKLLLNPTIAHAAQVRVEAD